MLVSREGLHDVQETTDTGHQLADGGITMISRDGVVQCFPQSLDSIDPGMVGRLKEQAKLSMRCQPRVSRLAFVGVIIVQDEEDFAPAPIALPKCLEQRDEEGRVFALGFHPNHPTAFGMQGPSERTLLIGAGGGDGELLALRAPAKANARIQINIGLLDIEDCHTGFCAFN